MKKRNYRKNQKLSGSFYEFVPYTLTNFDFLTNQAKKNYFQSKEGLLSIYFPISPIQDTIAVTVIKGKTWRSLDLSQSQGQSYLQALTYNNQVNIASNATISSNVTANTSPLLPQTQTYQRNHDFKNRRSSSEPNEQKLITTNPPTTNNPCDDGIKNTDDFIECLQNMTTIKVRNH